MTVAPVYSKYHYTLGVDASWPLFHQTTSRVPVYMRCLALLVIIPVQHGDRPSWVRESCEDPHPTTKVINQDSREKIVKVVYTLTDRETWLLFVK